MKRLLEDLNTVFNAYTGYTEVTLTNRTSKIHYKLHSNILHSMLRIRLNFIQLYKNKCKVK